MIETRYQSIYYPESRFGGFTDIDGTICFYNRVNALLKPEFVVIDFGCGRGSYKDDRVTLRKNLRILRGKVRKVIGLDVDKWAEENPFIDEFRLLETVEWPLGDNCADLCLSDSVMEHLQRPEMFFSECKRVLKNGGFLCIRTSNLWNYVSIFGKLVPERWHPVLLSKVQNGRKEIDVFRKFYRCNTIPKIRALLNRFGFDHVVYGYEAEPSYLSFSRIGYWLGTLHQRFAPGFIRPTIFVFARLNKPKIA